MQPSQLESTAVRQKLAVRNNNGSSKISLPPLPGFTGAEIKDSALTQRHKKTDMSRLRTKSHSTSSRTNDFAVNNETRDKLQINLPGIELNNRGVLKLPKIGETRIDPQSRRRSSSTPVKSHRESTYSQRGSISGAVIAGILGCSGGGSVSRNRFSRYATKALKIFMNEESEKNSSNAAASGTAVATNMKQPKSQVALDMIEDDEERHERANYRWKLAITIVMKINRSICVFSKAIGPEKNQEQQITNAANFSENSFTYMLRSFHSTSDIITNTRVQMLVKVNPEDRTIEAIQSLERFLRPRIGVFAKYNLAHRISICQQMKYEFFEKGRDVIKEGHAALNFYIILSGQVDVLKKRENTLIRLTRLNKGDSFGAIGVEGYLSKVRTATVRTSTDSEFLLVNVDDYREILLGRNSKLDVARRMEMVKDFPLFKGLQESVIHQIVLRSATRYYSHSDAIITEGRLNGGIFFLISGTVQVQKTMSAKQLAATTTSSKQTRGNIHSDGPQISTIVRRLMDMEERIDETETANNNDFGVRKRSIAKSRSSKSGSRDSVSASSRRTANTNNASFNVNNSNLRKSQALGEKQIDSEIANSRKALKIRQQPVAPLNGISDDMSSVHYSKPDQTSKIIDYEDAVVFELARLHPGQCFPEIVLPDHLPRSSICYRLRKTQGSLGMTTDEVNELLDAELKHRFVERGDSYQAYSSVICETPCTCLFIGRIDFLRIAPSALARSLFELIDDCYISEEDIGLEYREQNEWNDYKDKVMSVEYKGESFRKNH